MVSHIFLVERFLIVWSMCLMILFVLYGVTLVDCLLEAFPLSVSVVAVLIWKQKLLFCCVGGFLLNSFTVVAHREYGLCL